MNSTEKNEQRTEKSFITPAGAILAILCFFLPWVKFSCAGTQETASGMRLAQDEGLLWLVLITALAILGMFFYMRYRNTVWKSKLYALIGSAVALLVLLYEFIDFATGIDTEFGRIKPGDIGFTLQFGFFGTILGFIIAAIGAFLLPRGSPEARTEQLPEADVPKATPTVVREELAGTLSVLQRWLQSLGQRLRSWDWQLTGRRIGGYIMRSTKSSSFVQWITPVIKLAIGLVALLIIRYIVSVIPMIRDARVVGMPVTPLQIVFAVIDTIILLFLLNFGREFKKGLQLSLPNFTEAGAAANLVVIFIVICIAYVAYDGIVDVLTSGSYSWIYPVIFLCIALVPLYFLGFTLYKNIDKFTGLIVGKFRAGEKEGVVCSNCGASLSSETQFCPNCGQEVTKTEAEPGLCPNCGAKIEGDAKFCKECGTQFEQPSEEA